MALNGIKHTMQRRSLDLTLEALGVLHPDRVKLIADLYGNWYKQGRFRQAELLAMSVGHFRKEKIIPF